MTARIAAVAFGLITGVAAGLFLPFGWNGATAWLGIDQPNIISALTDPLTRLTWMVVTATAVFATAALLTALFAGIVETMLARARIDALRHDPALADAWNAADWRAAFAHTAIADRAEAVVAAILPAQTAASGGVRRVFADPVLLFDLESVWLGRLALTRTIAPLPGLLFGLGAVSALLRYASGEHGWEISLAAGASGWLFIQSIHYLARLLLAPTVELAVRAATAAIRPLTPALALDLVVQHLGEQAPVQEPATAAVKTSRQNPEAIAAAINAAMAEPLGRMAEAAERLGAAAAPLAGIADSIGGAVQQREHAIEAALAEVRAGIEQLLEAPPVHESSGATETASDAVRVALAAQTDTLRGAASDLQDGIHNVAGLLQGITEALGKSERQNTALLADLTRAVESLAPGGWAGMATADGSAPPPAPNPAIADALKTLLRDFDES